MFPDLVGKQTPIEQPLRCHLFYAVGRFRIESAGLKKDVWTGEILLQQAVQKGSVDAAVIAGDHYSPGGLFFTSPEKNEKGDLKKAIEMYRFAAERGHGGVFLALLYVEAGNGREALRWADGGDEPNASDEKAHAQWETGRSVADKGGFSTYTKGKVYALGVGDVKQDLGKAKVLFEEAYRKGNSLAACSLVAMYRERIGTERDMAKADQWRNNTVSQEIRSVGSDYADKARFAFADKQIEEFAAKLRAASAKRE